MLNACITTLPTLALLAQAVFLSQREQADRQTDRQTDRDRTDSLYPARLCYLRRG